MKPLIEPSSAEASTPWKTIGSAAVYASVSPATVKREIRAGRLRAYKVGGRLVRLHVSDLDAWLRSRQAIEPVKSKLKAVGR